MKRTKIKTADPFTKADAILVSDLHLTESTPVSRTDDYLAAQRGKLQFLQYLSDQNECPVLCAGDVFDHWKASPWLCSEAFLYLPHSFIGIPGQHDLPMHSLEHYSKSALSLVEIAAKESKTRAFQILKGSTIFNKLHITGVPFGELKKFISERSFVQGQGQSHGKKILMLHELIWQRKRPAWDEGSWTDQEILESFNGYFDLILTGDNHIGFITRRKDLILVNPGSMMRKTADQEDYKPRCYLYYAKENEIRPAFFPIEDGVHNREHIDRKREREDRVAAYIERMNTTWEIGLSFEKNLEVFFSENKVPRKIVELIWHYFEKEGERNEGESRAATPTAEGAVRRTKTQTSRTTR